MTRILAIGLMLPSKNKQARSPTVQRRSALGFTLLELLVVLVIIAVMAGLLVFSAQDSPERRLQREANALTALLNLAADEAVMQTRDFGLVIDDHGYHFVVFDPNKKYWMPLQQKPLAEHRFDEPYSVQFQLDGEQIDDATRARIDKYIAAGTSSADSSAESGGANKPLLLILSSGETAAFSLTLRHDQVAYTVSGDGFNPVEMHAGALDETAGSLK